MALSPFCQCGRRMKSVEAELLHENRLILHWDCECGAEKHQCYSPIIQPVWCYPPDWKALDLPMCVKCGKRKLTQEDAGFGKGDKCQICRGSTEIIDYIRLLIEHNGAVPIRRLRVETNEWTSNGTRWRSFDKRLCRSWSKRAKGALRVSSRQSARPTQKNTSRPQSP